MRKEVKILGAIAVIVIVAAVIGANYYRSLGPPPVVSNALVRPDSPTLGPADAPVTIVEFYDPECEACGAFNPMLKKILKDYEGRVRLVARYMPLHPNSLRAASFTEAAGEQGKYWQAQELLFQRQPEWGERHGPPTGEPPPDVPALFAKYGQELGLDMDKVNAALRENRYQAKLERDRQDGQSLGVRQTPTFFVNGRQVRRLGVAELTAAIEAELRK
jgi:protein-disulfide isomerase